MANIALTTIEECRNELADVRKDACLPTLRMLIAINNGHEIPSDLKADIQALGERELAARIALAGLREEDVPERPEYFDPAV